MNHICSRDIEGTGVAHKVNSPESSQDNNGAVLVR